MRVKMGKEADLMWEARWGRQQEGSALVCPCTAPISLSRGDFIPENFCRIRFQNSSQIPENFFRILSGRSELSWFQAAITSIFGNQMNGWGSWPSNRANHGTFRRNKKVHTLDPEPSQPQPSTMNLPPKTRTGVEREFFLDSLLVRIHFIIVMI